MPVKLLSDPQVRVATENLNRANRLLPTVALHRISDSDSSATSDSFFFCLTLHIFFCYLSYPVAVIIVIPASLTNKNNCLLSSLLNTSLFLFFNSYVSYSNSFPQVEQGELISIASARIGCWLNSYRLNPCPN